MKVSIRVLLLCFCFTIAGCHHGKLLHTAQGGEIAVSSLKGKWVVINYWSTWSESAKNELTEMNQVSRQFPSNVVFLSHNYLLLPHQSLSQTVNELNIDIPVVKESLSEIYDLPRVTHLPVLYIISPNGVLVDIIQGGRSKREIIDLLSRLIHVQHRAPVVVKPHALKKSAISVNHTEHHPLSSAQMV